MTRNELTVNNQLTESVLNFILGAVFLCVLSFKIFEINNL